MPRPCSNLFVRFVAECLNLAQVLPTFTSLDNVLLTLTKNLGLFREQLVRLCIIVSVKKRQPLGLPQNLVGWPPQGHKSDPGAALRGLCLICVDRGGFFHGQADIVQPVQQAMFAKRVHLELDLGAV